MSNESILSHEASSSLYVEQGVLYCVGNWSIRDLVLLKALYKRIQLNQPDVHQIDASAIALMDSAGALLFSELVTFFNENEQTVHAIGLDPKYQTMVDFIATEIQGVNQSLSFKPMQSVVYLIGRSAIAKCQQFMAFLTFVGELCFVFFKSFTRKGSFAFSNLLMVIESSGDMALPIVGLMSFLIGIVLVYQLGLQLEIYGANIFVVDVTGIAILREFAPLITAVILAGRTSTSFAALIGTMKVNEELDALRVMGISPINYLVVPRVLGMIFVLPLLVVWADLFGVIGSMFMAKTMLDINYISFISRFGHSVGVSQYVLGLVKAPVFASIISAVGCFQGLNVQYSADSVGKQTTKAAVQAIFLIIVADALFSILFSWMGL